MSDPDRRRVVTVPSPTGRGLQTIVVDPDDPAAVALGDRAPALADLTDAQRTALAEANREAVAQREADALSVPALAAEAYTSAVDEMSLGALSAGNEQFRESREDFAARRPIVDTGARAASWILPALMSGGTGAPAALARMTPGGAAAFAGTRAGGAVGRVMGGARFGRLAALATEGGVDGFLSGMGEEVARSNVQGTPLEAEQLLGSGLFGGMIGTGTGTVFGIPSALRPRRGVPGPVAPTSPFPTPDDPVLATGPEDLRLDWRPPRESASALTEHQAIFSGEDQIRLRRIQAGYEDGWRPNNPDGVHTAIHEGGRRLQDLANQVDDAFSELRTPARRQQVFAERLGDIAPTEREFNRWATMRAELEHVARQTTDTIAARHARRILGDLGTEAPTTAAEVARRMDAALDRYSALKVFQSLELRPTYRTAFTVARDEAIGAFSDMGIPSIGDFHQSNMLDFEGRSDWRDLLRRTPTRDGRPGTYRSNLSRLKQSFEAGSETWDPDEARKGLQAVMDDMVSRARVAEDLLGYDPTEFYQNVVRTNRALQEANARAMTRADLLQLQLNEKQIGGFFAGTGGQLINPAVGAIGGGIIGGPVGGVLGGLASLGLGAATHPVGAMQLFHAISERVGGTQARTATALGRLRASLSGRGARQGGRVVSAIGRRLASPEARREEYRTWRDRVAALAGSPTEAASVYGDGAPGVIGNHVSPVWGDTMVSTLQAGVAHLQANLPAVDRTSLSAYFGDPGDLEPSLTEMTSWLRRVEAIEDPVSVIDHAARGSLEVEHVEALAATYPRFYQGLQQEVADIIADLDDIPAYQQRIHLATLLQVDLDSTVTPSFVHSMQQTFAQTTQQDRAQHSGPASRRAMSMRYADDTQTVTQSISQTLG